MTYLLKTHSGASVTMTQVALDMRPHRSPKNRLDSTLELFVLDNLGFALFVGKTHVGGEGAVWHPLGRVAGVGLLEHAVDLLEREALSLGNQEVRVDEAEEAERSPDEEDLGAKVCVLGTDHIWGDDGDDLSTC